MGRHPVAVEMEWNSEISYIGTGKRKIVSLQTWKCIGEWIYRSTYS